MIDVHKTVTQVLPQRRMVTVICPAASLDEPRWRHGRVMAETINVVAQPSPCPGQRGER
jgi:hypothetical protein